MKKPRVTRSISLEPELAESLKQIAAKQNRNFNNLVQTILAQYVKERS